MLHYILVLWLYWLLGWWWYPLILLLYILLNLPEALTHLIIVPFLLDDNLLLEIAELALLRLDLFLVFLHLCSILTHLRIQPIEFFLSLLSFSLRINAQSLVIIINPLDLSLVLVKLTSLIEFFPFVVWCLLLEAIEVRGIVYDLLLLELHLALQRAIFTNQTLNFHLFLLLKDPLRTNLLLELLNDFIRFKFLLVQL